MTSTLNSVLFTVATVLAVAMLPVSDAQLRLEFCGSTEVPSLKCIVNPGRVDMDVKNRTLCFCVMIQGTIPTYNCLRADGKVTMEDLQNLVGLIRNLTSTLPPLPTRPAPEDGNDNGNGNVGSQFALPNSFGFDGFNRNSYEPSKSAGEDSAKNTEEQNDNVNVDSSSNGKEARRTPLETPSAMGQTFFRL